MTCLTRFNGQFRLVKWSRERHGVALVQLGPLPEAPDSSFTRSVTSFESSKRSWLVCAEFDSYFRRWRWQSVQVQKEIRSVDELAGYEFLVGIFWHGAAIRPSHWLANTMAGEFIAGMFGDQGGLYDFPDDPPKSPREPDWTRIRDAMTGLGWIPKSRDHPAIGPVPLHECEFVSGPIPRPLVRQLSPKPTSLW